MYLISRKYTDSAVSFLIFYLRRTAKVLFSSLGLFIFLSVSNITDKRVNGLSWNFQDGSGMEQVTFYNIWGILFHTRLYCFTFPELGATEVYALITSESSFDVFFDLGLYQQLRKQWSRQWFEIPWRSLWRHCNDNGDSNVQGGIKIGGVDCIALFIFEIHISYE